MTDLADIYRPSLALNTDEYQLTMAYGYWKNGMHESDAVFHLFFRKHPFSGGYTIACGLDLAISYIENFHFDDEDLAFLAQLEGNDGRRLLEDAFLDDLGELKLAVDIDAVPEGTAVFPLEPMVRVKGPLLHCQLLESPLLNQINFPTLVATKAARIVDATGFEPVLEFGMRRAQGLDGALSAARASYIGGCAGTSNMLAGRLYGIPTKGTHAHSWVMSHESEEDSFRAYARAMPNNCIFLVDTYDSLAGTRHAIDVGNWLREQGHQMVGIRLDSGDLAELSIQAREMLDDAGFEDTDIVGSNELDEYSIRKHKERGGRINLWGVGTHLVTAHDDPALGGVYKLSGVKDESGDWQYRLKLSDEPQKVTNPGIQQVRRFYDGDTFAGDVIYDTEHPPRGETELVDPADFSTRQRFAQDTPHDDLLVPIYRGGQLVCDRRELEDARRRTREQLEALPDSYPTGLERWLADHKQTLMQQAREAVNADTPQADGE